MKQENILISNVIRAFMFLIELVKNLLQNADVKCLSFLCDEAFSTYYF